ncbi:TIGR04282 family arsenosugar biosynthesis glycosyltransferase [Agaribacter flavus]|uniref:DUF2064 domain-containing protein n=1 Tax=Agaribacter flavus TaxID=1902781 RepID=A0ABV7FJX5_9ALTE
MKLSEIDGELPTLVIFCKRPLLNQGKSRLATSLGAESALKVANGLLNCALEDALAWPGRLVLTISNHADMAWAEQLLDRKLQVLPQIEGNLGERINHIDRKLRQEGHQSLVFIGTDAPVLDGDHYYQTIRQLQSKHYVFSRAQDGGVCLMANAIPWPTLSALPWSTSRLCDALANCCEQNLCNTASYREANRAIAYVKPSYDIDEEISLNQLYQDLEKDSRPARRQLLATLDALNYIKENKQYA